MIGFILVRFVCSSWCQLSVFSDKDCSPGTREGGRNTFTKGNLCPAFRQIAEGRELFVLLLCLNCLQLKIIFMLQQHILGQHTLIAFTCSLLGLNWLYFLCSLVIGFFFCKRQICIISSGINITVVYTFEDICPPVYRDILWALEFVHVSFDSELILGSNSESD